MWGIVEYRKLQSTQAEVSLVVKLLRLLVCRVPVVLYFWLLLSRTHKACQQQRELAKLKQYQAI
jgi:uncharacterized membrane protein YadS